VAGSSSPRRPRCCWRAAPGFCDHRSRPSRSRTRALPDTGGIDGALQDLALRALDRAACKYGSSREELALALVDADARAEFQRKYGVDPRRIGGLLQAILGL
jgi:hypothetical protein